MTGKYASQVRFNYEGIKGKEYSSDIFKEWEEAIKGAILADVREEGVYPSEMRLEQCHRYALAQEEVIVDLLYRAKYGRERIKLQDDDYQG